MESLKTVSDIFSALLPIFGVIVLVLLIFILVKLLNIVKKADATMGTVGTYVEELKTTVKTVTNYSSDADGLRVFVKNAVIKFYKQFVSEYESIKKMITDLLPKNNKNEIEEVKGEE